MMKHIKKLLLIFLIFFFLILFWVSQNIPVETKTIEDTIELKGSVLQVQDTGIRGNTFWLIYMKEYENGWHINSVLEKDMDVLKHLEQGTGITIRIDKNSQADVDKTEFIEVMSLEAGDEVLFSIEDYHRYEVKDRARTQRFGWILLGIDIVIVSVWVLSIVKKRKRSSNEAN